MRPARCRKPPVRGLLHTDSKKVGPSDATPIPFDAHIPSFQLENRFNQGDHIPKFSGQSIYTKVFQGDHRLHRHGAVVDEKADHLAWPRSIAFVCPPSDYGGSPFEGMESGHRVKIVGGSRLERMPKGTVGPSPADRARTIDDFVDRTVTTGIHDYIIAIFDGFFRQNLALDRCQCWLQVTTKTELREGFISLSTITRTSSDWRMD